ncbi:MAG TPA: FMN-binding protein [Spirochaetales bacterium]|nr:FMN-binding protein [Spirochaetales bacterium]HPM73964.1 FMN-binding protein [Spirochaetales bacterium]
MSARRAITSAAALVALAVATLGSCALPDIRVTTPPFSGLPDGAYRGYYDGGIVKAEVEATLAGGSLTAVTILRHDCGKGRPAEAIVDEVVAAQSLDVDVVAGATYSSKVILKAIEIALTDGRAF